MTENEPGRVVALAAQTQQLLVQAQRQIQFAAVDVIARLPIRNIDPLRRLGERRRANAKQDGKHSEREKVAAPHSMTSSARARIDGGIVSPSDRAVLAAK